MKKGSLVTSSVIILLVSLITLILLISIFFVFFNDNKVQTANYECRMLFSTIDPGKDFGNNFNSIPLKLEQSIQKICPSRDAKVSDKNIGDAAKLIEECWFKTGSGRDFLGKNAESSGLSMCIFCGTIKPRENSEDIQDFNKLISDEFKDTKYEDMLSEETQVENTNAMILTNPEYIPSRINSNTHAAVFYYIHKPQVKCESGEGFENCQNYVRTSISTFFSGFENLRGITRFLSESSVRGVGGIIVLPIEVRDGFDGNLDTSNFDGLENCHFIIPEENFN